MKRVMALILALLLALPLCACTPEPTENQNGYGLWFAVEKGYSRDTFSAVAQEQRIWEGQPTARQLMDALLAGPQTEGLRSPFPDGVSVRSMTLEVQSKTLRVDLSEQYGGLAGYDLTLADSCIALTLCQLPGVERVEVLAAGETIPYRNRQGLRRGDVLLSTEEGRPEIILATLYFPSREENGKLTVEYRPVEHNGEQNTAQLVLKELLQGPTDRQAAFALPLGTQVLDMTVEGDICKVNLSRGFLRSATTNDRRGRADLYALVNTLCALNQISQVRVQVEGRDVDSYAGVSLQDAIAPDYDLLR